MRTTDRHARTLKVHKMRNNLVMLCLCLTAILVSNGCAERRTNIAYQGLVAINELDNLEPDLAEDIDPAFFAPWKNVAGLRQLTPHERLILESQMGLIFTPDEQGQKIIESQFVLFTQRLRQVGIHWSATAIFPSAVAGVG